MADARLVLALEPQVVRGIAEPLFRPLRRILQVVRHAIGIGNTATGSEVMARCDPGDRHRANNGKSEDRRGEGSPVAIDFNDSVLIARPVSEVFAFVADHENLPAWTVGVKQSQRLTPGPPRTGTRYRVVGKLLGCSVEGSYDVTAFEPDSSFEGTMSSPMFAFCEEYRFVSRDQGLDARDGPAPRTAPLPQAGRGSRYPPASDRRPSSPQARPRTAVTSRRDAFGRSCWSVAELDP